MSQKVEKRGKQDQYRSSSILSETPQVLITMNESSQHTSSWNFKSIKDENPKKSFPRKWLAYEKRRIRLNTCLLIRNERLLSEDYPPSSQGKMTFHLYLHPAKSIQMFSDTYRFPTPTSLLEEDLAVYCSKMNEPWRRKIRFSRTRILIWTVMKGSPDNCKWPGITNPVWNRTRENWERLERARKDKCIKG